VILEHVVQVGELVGGGDEFGAGGLPGELLDVGALARLPLRFGLPDGIGARLDEFQDVGAEVPADLGGEGDGVLAVLERVVEKSRDGLVLAGAVLDRGLGNVEDVHHVADRRPLARLLEVHSACQRDGRV